MCNCNIGLACTVLYPVYMIKQTSSKHPANAFKIYVHDVPDVCLMIA